VFKRLKTIFIKRYMPARRKICLSLFMIIVLLLGTQQAHAQLLELEIKLIEQPPAGPVVFLNHPGQVVVIVRSSLTTLNFSSTMEILEQRNDPDSGEYRIVIRPENQILTVNSPGYVSEGIQLRGLQPNDRFYYSVEPVGGDSGNTLTVVFRVTPAGTAGLAVASIDGEQVDISRPVELEPGIYPVEITANGFRTLRETIEVTHEQIFFEFTMQELQEEVVRIRTEPSGATVFINEIEEGTTDRSGLLELFRLPGEYEISLFLSGHQGLQQTISVEEQGPNAFSFELVRNTATLLLDVEPANARATINRQPVDMREPIDLSAGAHRLEISLDGYEPYSENLSAERGQQMERTISLEAHTGGLQFRVNPTFAQVVLRDSDRREIDRWSGIRRIESLKTGFYTVSVEAAGYQGHEEEFEITRDEITQKTIRLLEEQPVAAVRREPAVQPDEIVQPQSFPELVPSLPSRSTAVTTSLFLPGGGHIYSGRSRGYLYLAGGLAAGGFAAWTFMQEKSIKSDYNNALQQYSGANSFSDSRRYAIEILQHYDDWNDLIDQRTVALAAFGGIYALQLLDILISTPQGGYRGERQGNSWQASATGTGFRLRYNFN